jgi:hypothetical protein
MRALRRHVRLVPNADSRTATNSSVFDHLVGEQQDRFRDGEPERLARGFKPDIGNPVALAPAQAGLFTLVLEGCRRASKQRRFYILKCVHADDGVEAAVDSAGGHRHHACACRKSNPDILMMQPAQYRSTIDVPCPLNSARYWRILLHG